MAVDDTIETEGKITSVLAGTMFRVELGNQHSVLAHISGKMRKRFIRLTNGDRVKLEMSPYDLTKARIVYRLGEALRGTFGWVQISGLRAEAPRGRGTGGGKPMSGASRGGEKQISQFCANPNRVPPPSWRVSSGPA